MYFVTTKQDGYILFSMTPSERAAVGLTDQQEVHILGRAGIGDAWRVIARWNVSDFSHTDLMSAWHQRAEPQQAEELLQVLPAPARANVRRDA